MGKKLEIEVGMKFGRLTIIKEVSPYVQPNGKSVRKFLCKCVCGKEVEVRLASLVRGATHSCGCLKDEITIKTGKNNKKFNTFDILQDYAVGYTQKGEIFKIDLDDYEKVKSFCWYIHNRGYVATQTSDGIILLHRLIMDCPDGLQVDHINHNKSDNRKCNLRICTNQQNNRNKCSKGIAFDKRVNKWQARIYYNGKNLYLGSFTNKEDAIAARKAGELKYFGEFAFQGEVSNS